MVELIFIFIRNQYSSLLQNHQKLRSEYQKLLSVTSELTSGLEDVAQAGASRNTHVDWKNVKILCLYENDHVTSHLQILTKCVQLFPELFNKLPAPSSEVLAVTGPGPEWSCRTNTLLVSSPQPPSPAPAPSHQTPPPPPLPSNYAVVAAAPPPPRPPSPPLATPAITEEVQQLSADKLNYSAIHEELEGHSVRGKLLLMQALRWVHQHYREIKLWMFFNGIFFSSTSQKAINKNEFL